MYLICRRTNFHTSNCNGTSVVANKPKANEHFWTVAQFVTLQFTKEVTCTKVAQFSNAYYHV
jgi:hypothetical protein